MQQNTMGFFHILLYNGVIAFRGGKKTEYTMLAVWPEG